MNQYQVMFAPSPGRNSNIREVEAHDRAHAAFKGWRAAGNSRFPRVEMINPDQYRFDGVTVTVIIK